MPTRGSRPGERRGGRKSGVPNKATADVRAAAQQYTQAAIARLAHLMEHAESEAAQVAAARELLDRAHGRPAQSLTADVNLTTDPMQELLDFIGARENAIPTQRTGERIDHG